ncbi:MAG: hypothetical protein NTZ21_04575 [Actinobacteria bacterium]|nr:hypothetical protein [Actinomycetota bacterium]
MTDPFDVLRSHVRSVALLEHPDTEPDDLVAQITGVADPMPDGASVIAFPHHRSPISPSRGSHGSPRRRRWLVAAGVSAIVVVGGAGVAAFVGTRPSAPAAGVVCRASVSNSSAIVIEPTADPVAACADLWARGDLPEIDVPKPTTPGSPEVPRLVACVGEGLALQVLPLPEYWSCADAGLADADITGITDDPAVRLQAALVDRVNAGGCRTTADVAAIAREVLDSMDLATWSVKVSDPSSACATVALDVSTSHVIVRPHPSAQEKP